MRNVLLFIWSTLGIGLFIACDRQPDRSAGAGPANRIIDRAVAVHGGDNYQKFTIDFDFRKFHLHLQHDGGRFRYERTYADSAGRAIREVLTNDTLLRYVDNQPQRLDTAGYRRWSNAVNSVAYFVLLPYKLQDPAVMADYVGDVQLDGQLYDKVRVRFRAEGGGEDYRDTFFYWFNRQTGTMDFLAYSEGGPRFRKAVNPRTVGGIRFQDYINYKGDDNDTTSVGTYDERYRGGQLPVLSRIEQTNIRVTH